MATAEFIARSTSSASRPCPPAPMITTGRSALTAPIVCARCFGGTFSAVGVPLGHASDYPLMTTEAAPTHPVRGAAKTGDSERAVQPRSPRSQLIRDAVEWHRRAAVQAQCLHANLEAVRLVGRFSAVSLSISSKALAIGDTSVNNAIGRILDEK